jgi:hypothetical protein
MIECGLPRLLLLLNNSRIGVGCDAAWDHGDKKAESSANYRTLIYTKTQRRRGLSYWQQTGRTTRTTTNPALDLKSASLHVFRNILKRLLLLQQQRAVVLAAVLALRLPQFHSSNSCSSSSSRSIAIATTPQELCLQHFWREASLHPGGRGQRAAQRGQRTFRQQVFHWNFSTKIIVKFASI